MIIHIKKVSVVMDQTTACHSIEEVNKLDEGWFLVEAKVGDLKITFEPPFSDGSIYAKMVSDLKIENGVFSSREDALNYVGLQNKPMEDEGAWM